MSLMGEHKIQDKNDPPKCVHKCRIPQRFPCAKSKPVPSKFKAISDIPHSQARPKSANRLKDDSFSRTTYCVPRSERPERGRVPLKRPAMTLKRTMNDGKSGKAIITIPLSISSQSMDRRHPTSHLLRAIENANYQKHKYYSRSSGLPDQETIKKCEDLELQKGLIEGTSSPGEEESPGSGDDVMEQKLNWQQYTKQYEEMKNDLGERQKAIMELYASMRNAHQKMIAMGLQVSLPSFEDLTIMNVARLTPDQLLQMCAMQEADGNQNEHPLSIDINKLYGLPSKIIATCEETLLKRKEIIDWFVALKSEAKAISTQSLQIKINEFVAENDMLRSSLDHAKGNFLKELNQIIDFMRKTVNEAVALQLRTEQQTYEMSELNSLNIDLRKQLRTMESLRSNKSKFEELEKELKEYKCKNNLLRDHLSRTEGQLKIGIERVSELEAALEQSRSKTWNLERTVQQLQEQNQNMQADFDKELGNMTESIRDNTIHLEEIAEAREKLQAEKEDLENRLAELSEYYNKSLKSMKHDMNIKTVKLIETEKKYEEELDQNKNLAVKLETMAKQSNEYERQNKELFAQIQEKDEQLCKFMDYERELQLTKNDLHLALGDLKDYKMQLVKQHEAIKSLKHDLEDSLCAEDNLRTSLNNKEEVIIELSRMKSLLEEQLQESERKMTSQEQQLITLKNHIKQLQTEFGEFESLPELHDMINQQRTQLLEATRQNEELAQALQKKDLELEHDFVNTTEHKQLIDQKDAVIKMLSDKKIEQDNIIKLLRTNLEIRTKGEMDLTQQVFEKNSKIDILMCNLDKQEKIILALEKQRKIDKDKISLLKKQIAASNAYKINNKHFDIPSKNIDNIIKIFEEELGTSCESQFASKSDEYVIPRHEPIKEKIYRQVLGYEKENNNQKNYQTDHESVPTKIVMGNFVKKTYIPTNDDQYKVDNLHRKKAITNIDAQKWMVPQPNKMYAATGVGNNTTNPSFETTSSTSSYLQNNIFLSRNLPFLNINQLQDQKNSKMFRIAGHRL